MKIKTAELTGAALDWAVAKCKGVLPKDWNATYSNWQAAGYSTDWAQGGPIIDENIHAFDHMQSNRVCAIIRRSDMWHGGFSHGYGPTPLIAAMRCFVASKLGDEVEIPDELL